MKKPPFATFDNASRSTKIKPPTLAEVAAVRQAILDRIEALDTEDREYLESLSEEDRRRAEGAMGWVKGSHCLWFAGEMSTDQTKQRVGILLRAFPHLVDAVKTNRMLNPDDVFFIQKDALKPPAIEGRA